MHKTERTIAHQAPLPVAFSRWEYCGGWLFPPPGDLPDPGIESESLASPLPLVPHEMLYKIEWPWIKNNLCRENNFSCENNHDTDLCWLILRLTLKALHLDFVKFPMMVSQGMNEPILQMRRPSFRGDGLPNVTGLVNGGAGIQPSLAFPGLFWRLRFLPLCANWAKWWKKPLQFLADKNRLW